MVENRRLELLTPCVQSRCSTNWANPPLSNLSGRPGLRGWAICAHKSYYTCWFFFVNPFLWFYFIFLLYFSCYFLLCFAGRKKTCRLDKGKSFFLLYFCFTVLLLFVLNQAFCKLIRTTCRSCTTSYTF